MLTDRVVFVTGGGRGIGRATALAFAAAGARTVVAARSVDQVEAVAAEVVQAGGRALPLVCDVTSGSSVASAVEETGRHFGPVDVLVNNAGYVESAPLTRVTDETWNRTLAVNLTGTFLCLRAVLPSMVERQRGRVISIASTAAEIGYAYTAAYCAAKHGVLGLTRSVALEVAAKGVTVNAICPGWVLTGMSGPQIEVIAAREGISIEAATEILLSEQPSKSFVTREQIGAAVAFLCTDAAAQITGATFPVDGGIMAG